MDRGETEHTGCPVYEGNKKIVTQWIRLGVNEERTYQTYENAKANPPNKGI